jgi:predicted transcriptional regulator
MENKAVLISIHENFCNLIKSGEKTVEIRKSIPKIPLPFKCYIYQTRGGGVIGEFICKRIDEYTLYSLTEADCWRERRQRLLLQSCLTWNQLFFYADGKQNFCKAWHISNLIIYDVPKAVQDYGIKKAPQSWCYVDERKGEQ